MSGVLRKFIIEDNQRVPVTEVFFESICEYQAFHSWWDEILPLAIYVGNSAWPDTPDCRSDRESFRRRMRTVTKEMNLISKRYISGSAAARFCAVTPAIAEGMVPPHLLPDWKYNPEMLLVKDIRYLRANFIRFYRTFNDFINSEKGLQIFLIKGTTNPIDVGISVLNNLRWMYGDLLFHADVTLEPLTPEERNQCYNGRHGEELLRLESFLPEFYLNDTEERAKFSAHQDKQHTEDAA